MRSAKSCFSPTLFRKNLVRFWPIWGLYLFIWLLVLPLGILNTFRNWDGYNDMYALSTLSLGAVGALCFGILAAMAVFSYLYNNRSVQLIHALPVTREGLFVTNYLSGLLFLLGPNVIVFALSLLAGGAAAPRTLVLWLVAQSLMCLFFYSFAIFCAMFTGNLLALPVFYGILNFLVIALSQVLDYLMGQFLFGYAGSYGGDELVEWFTPIMRIGRQLSHERRIINGVETSVLLGLPTLLAYGLVALVLTGIALVLYRRRALEMAGDLVSVAWVRPIFKYGVAFCAAVTLGSFLYTEFRSLLPSGRWAILLPLIFAGLIGYFAAEMLLKKRFKVFTTAWKGSVAFSLALLALFVVGNNDLVGFNRAPARSSVVSVQIDGPYTAPYDGGNGGSIRLTRPEDIDAALALHQAIVNSRAAIEQDIDYSGGGYDSRPQMEPLSGGRQLEVETFTTSSVDITYELSSGKMIRRSYQLPFRAERLEGDNTVEHHLTELLNRPHLLEQRYWDFPDGLRLVDVSMNTYPSESDGEDTVSLGESDAQREALLAAVKADMAAGRIGTRYLMETAARYTNCYYNDLRFTFLNPPVSITSGNSTKSENYEVTVTLQTTATETLKVLAELGYTDGKGLTRLSDHYAIGSQK